MPEIQTLDLGQDNYKSRIISYSLEQICIGSGGYSNSLSCLAECPNGSYICFNLIIRTGVVCSTFTYRSGPNVYSGNVAFVDGTESYIYVTEFHKKYVTKHSWSKDEESEAWIQIPYRVELARGTAKIVGAKQK